LDLRVYDGNADSTSGSSALTTIWGSSQTAFTIPGTIRVTPYKGTYSDRSVSAISGNLQSNLNEKDVLQVTLTAAETATLGPLKVEWFIAGATSVSTPYSYQNPVYRYYFQTRATFTSVADFETWMLTHPYGCYYYGYLQIGRPIIYDPKYQWDSGSSNVMHYSEGSVYTPIDPYNIIAYTTHRDIDHYDTVTGSTTANYNWSYSAIPTYFYVTPDGNPPSSFKISI
jgi:hypothetical protein